MKGVRGPRSRLGCWADRETVTVLRGSANVCMLMNLENSVCACSSELLTLLAGKEEGGCLCFT